LLKPLTGTAFIKQPFPAIYKLKCARYLAGLGHRDNLPGRVGNDFGNTLRFYVFSHLDTR
jgi:hypothetical protein